jgi:N-acetylneuraminate synthase
VIKIYNENKNTPFIIAEIGINHNGSIDLAKKLIDMAIDCGCDAVKFQKRNPDICIPEWKKNDMRDTPWGHISYLEYKKKIEFGRKEYDILDNYCKIKNIVWFASAWDLESLKFLDKYNLQYNKISSALLTNIPFVKEVAKRKKKTLISTGMSTYKDVDNVIEIFVEEECPFVLNHCISTYPANHDDLNLNIIITIKKRYKCEVGYSGHEVDLLPSILAVSLGATYIERHITLDRAMFGTDQAASLERRGLEILVRDAKSVQKILGSEKKVFSEKEKEISKKQRYWSC